MEIILTLIAMGGFIIAIAALIFTEQGREIFENIQYHITRNLKRIKKHQKDMTSDIDENHTMSKKKESRFIRDVSIIDRFN